MPLNEPRLDAQQVRQRWQALQASVADCCRRSGRPSDSVRIVGVSKYVDVQATGWLVQAGCADLGESRPQAIWEKSASIQVSAQPPEKPAVRWHLLGHLQRNKVRRTIPLVHCIHSIDSIRLLDQIQRDAADLQLVVRGLAEVNVTTDPSKTGMAPNQLESLLERAVDCPNVRIEGLMGMSRVGGTNDQIRGDFGTIRRIRDALQQKFSEKFSLDSLSMGMSGDYPLAIEEGATLIRIGSSLWEGIGV
jgi:hypothetical protein